MKYLAPLHCLVAGLLWLVTLTFAVSAQSANQSSEPIPVAKLGASAGAQYHGDGLSVTPTPEGARLRCVFQKLEGQATAVGLWLTSTAENSNGERFRVVASEVGRGTRCMPGFDQSADGGHGVTRSTLAVPCAGTVGFTDKLARFIRSGLTEEYSVSVDGVRQDFVIAQRPAGGGALRVELDVTGARAEALVDGARLVLDGSGRKLAYSRLQVTDAAGKALTARMEVMTDTRLAVLVEDAAATYPVRIDPTFSDADWISMGGLIGANGTVRATAVDASGNLYIGGSFSMVGEVLATNVAKWNGTTWAPLGSGVDSTVLALAVSGTNLYAGGSFTNAGGSNANYVAKWNGSAWSALGSGLNGAAQALAVSGSDLYVGGNFTTVGGNSATNVAKWDGSAWSALGSGLNGGVRAIAVSGSDLFVGGNFTYAGDIIALYVAKWNGSAWSAVGFGLNNPVYALAVSDTNLYVGGNFSTAGGSSANCVAKWNGSAWSALGLGLNGTVNALAVVGTNLYAGGEFATAGGGGSANYLAQWSGSAWSAVGSGMSGGTPFPYVYALTVSGSDLYVGGSFFAAGPYGVYRVAKWSGGVWMAVWSGVDSQVKALAVSGSDLYVAGNFYTAGGNNARLVAKWNGSTWSPLGSGLINLPFAIAASGSNVYLGGSFTFAGGSNANYVAKWNGSAWSALGAGLNDFVYALAVSGTNLYVGGSFKTAGGNSANRIAKWDGSAWSALGSGLNGTVQALAVSGSDLYVGGSFTTATNTGGATVTVNRVAKWNGSAWSALGTGLTGSSANALAVAGSDLYVGGNFTTAGGNGATNMAKWNGSAWSALGWTGSYVIALAVSGSNLYAGGSFTTTDGSSANRVAKWDGIAWLPLGSGVSDTVNALAVSGSDLYVGGVFKMAGGKPSAYIARAIIGGATPEAPVFTSIVPSPSGTQAVLTFTAVPSASYYLLSSTNLTTWQTNSTVNASGVTNSVSVNLTQPHEFFRLRQLP
jgi:hypothetical protein